MKKVKKSLIGLEDKSMTRCWGSTNFFRPSQQLPCLCIEPLKGFFELTLRPSKALDLPLVLLPEIQKYKGHRQVCRARHRGPRTLSKIADANLQCAFDENALYYNDPLL